MVAVYEPKNGQKLANGPVAEFPPEYRQRGADKVSDESTRPAITKIGVYQGGLEFTFAQPKAEIAMAALKEAGVKFEVPRYQSSKLLTTIVIKNSVDVLGMADCILDKIAAKEKNEKRPQGEKRYGETERNLVHESEGIKDFLARDEVTALLPKPEVKAKEAEAKDEKPKRLPTTRVAEESLKQFTGVAFKHTNQHHFPRKPNGCFTIVVKDPNDAMKMVNKLTVGSNAPLKPEDVRNDFFQTTEAGPRGKSITGRRISIDTDAVTQEVVDKIARLPRASSTARGVETISTGPRQNA